VIRVDDAVGAGDAFGRIAQERIIQAERLRELAVLLRRVDTDRKVGDIERADLIAALPERLAFRGSPAAERFREPREHDGLLVLVI
jgi:hypothetical protein